MLHSSTVPDTMSQRADLSWAVGKDNKITRLTTSSLHGRFGTLLLILSVAVEANGGS